MPAPDLGNRSLMVLTALWPDRHDLDPPAPAELAGEWEVLVIGGGITGLTTAALLARAGRAVAVVEARTLGAGTTGRSTAKVSLLQGTHFSRVRRRHSEEVLRQYAEANREGLAWITRFCDDHEVECQSRPAYTYATTEQGERTARAELDALHAAGVDEADWATEVGLPFATRGAVTLPDQRQVDPMDLVRALAADARRHGATVIEGARVRRVRGSSPVHVVADRGSATADQVVVATNMPILDRGGFFARATPQRSYSLAFHTPTPAVDGMYLSADSPTRSLRDVTDPEGSLLLVGGDGHRTGADTSEASHLEALRAWTHEHFPDATETHAWSAQDYATTSAVPYVGPVLPGADHLLVAGGYSKWGFTNGVAAALAISGRLLGDRQRWAAAYEPWSSRDAAGLPGALKANAEVGLEMAEGWLRALRHPRGAGVCTHLGGVVRWNDAERTWDCPLHGSRFDTDRSVLDGPATCGLRRL